MQLIDRHTPLSQLQNFLQDLGWLNDEEITGIEIPGEGNMNVVLRVTTDRRSFILKQSRPFVQKYPDLPAPLERIEVEYQFHKATGEAIQDHAALILHYAPEHHLLMITDLGDCEDMVSIYAARKIDDQDLQSLVTILKNIHELPAPIAYPANLALRQLNHQHIFELPFMLDNGFQLDDVQIGLQELSLIYKSDKLLKSKIKSLGEKYLDKGKDLIHGDYYPGSWMKTSDQVYIIDAEFSFVGFKEFDLGVMVAHLMMTTSEVAYLDKVTNYYNSSLDKELVSQVAGVEIMRRLIGLAQLPLERTLEEKADLLAIARKLILNK